MTAALKIKAILMKEDGLGNDGRGVEIRRFRLDGEERDKFQSLLTRVHSLFGIDTSDNCCHLFWKDNDDDLVEFSSSEELWDAVENMSDDTVRVYITQSPNNGEGEMQTGSNTVETEEVETEKKVTFDSAANLYPSLRWAKKSKKMMDKAQKKMDRGKDNEFFEIRKQVPGPFRQWVRQNARTWYWLGPEIAAIVDNVPEGVDQHFPHWLHVFLDTYRHRQQAEGKEEEMPKEGAGLEEILPAPDGLPQTHYRWICLFVPRFFRRQNRISASGSDSESGDGVHGRGFHKKGGRHCHEKKCKRGQRRGGQMSSASESEESDTGEKAHERVPKEFRRYMRVSMNQLHKDNGDRAKIKERATKADVSPDVQEFVEQTLLEWHAKLNSQHPRDVSKEMIEAERSLPTGLEKHHYEWLLRFMARWHRKNARKCEAMSTSSSSGETTDDTSGDEAPRRHGFGRRNWMMGPKHSRAAMRLIPGYVWNMRCHHDHGPMYGTHPGMGHPGCHRSPPCPPCWARRLFGRGGRRGCMRNRHQDA